MPCHGEEGGEIMITTLIVDDEEPILSVVTRMLQCAGHRAVTAHGGEEAVRIYGEACQGEGEPIDVVIVDYLMPQMDGADTCRALREINPRVKILMASGLGTEFDRVDAEALGVDSFLTKPYEIDELAKAIEDTVEAKQAAG